MSIKRSYTIKVVSINDNDSNDNDDIKYYGRDGMMLVWLISIDIYSLQEIIKNEQSNI